MKIVERFVIACLLLAALSAAFTILGSWLPWSGHRILHSATAAAWTQTVGTVLAMLTGAGAIAWQVRFETRREARRELQRDLRATQEILELVEVTGRHLKALRRLLLDPCDRAALQRHILDQDNDLRWHELGIVFEETVVATIPGARLKLAFLRARSGYNTARGTYNPMWQGAHGDADPLLSEPRRQSFARAARLLDEAASEIRSAIEIITQLAADEPAD